MNILIIDDNRALRDALGMMIETMGGQAAMVATAEEGMKKLETGHYDVVLLDLKMPVKDGMWFIRHAHLPADTKVIAMSGFIPGMVLREMYKMGVSGFLEKPFDAEALLAAFEECTRPGSNALSFSSPKVNPRRTAPAAKGREYASRDPFGPQRIRRATFNAVIQGLRN